MTSKILQDIGVKPFRPMAGFQGGHKQTIGSRFFPQAADVKPNEFIDLRLSDGDFIRLAVNRPQTWRPGERIVVMIHGLTGCYKSKYIIRLNRLALQNGYMSVRVNLRNSGPGLGLARGIYHSGRSEDAAEVIEFLSSSYPESSITLVGFSLGANISLKLLGELGPRKLGRLDSVVGVSAPADLEACSRLLSIKENAVYAKYFMKDLRKLVQAIPKFHPDLQEIHLPEDVTIRQFDELYTAPRGGFKDALDYYSSCSCGPFIEKIEVPSLVLVADDDPVIDSEFYRQIPTKSNLDLVFTESGGHVGFLSQPDLDHGIRWMDHLIMKWIAKKTA